MVNFFRLINFSQTKLVWIGISENFNFRKIKWGKMLFLCLSMHFRSFLIRLSLEICDFGTGLSLDFDVHLISPVTWHLDYLTVRSFQAPCERRSIVVTMNESQDKRAALTVTFTLKIGLDLFPAYSKCLFFFSSMSGLSKCNFKLVVFQIVSIHSSFSSSFSFFLLLLS